MSKNKFGVYQVGQTVNYKGNNVVILTKQKGGKTTAVNKQRGIVTGLKSRPCTYSLSNGLTVRGDKLTNGSK